MSGALPPSEKRRSEARAAGRVPVSPLAAAAAALASGALIAWATGTHATARVVALARTAWGGGELEPAVALDLALSTVARVALPVALGAWLAAIATSALQTRGLFALRAIGGSDRREPDDPTALQPVAWALAAALVVLGVLVARSTARALGHAQGIAGALMVVGAGVRTLVPRALVLVAAAALGDWAWRHVRHERSLLMTRAELARERREEEGDPRLRAERRRRHRALTSQPP